MGMVTGGAGEHCHGSLGVSSAVCSRSREELNWNVDIA